jgi:formylglycine-generating enzyme required for sulfatase activity
MKTKILYLSGIFIILSVIQAIAYVPDNPDFMSFEKKSFRTGLSGFRRIDVKTFTNSTGMEFVYIPAGEFMMGSNNGSSDEKPVHKVKITKGFYLQKTEVTQGQWKSVMGHNPSYFEDCGDDCPVENVSWNDVQKFLAKLNKKEKTGKYRLPTEAEWEYAARAGTKTEFAFGNCLSTDHANYNGNPLSGCSKGEYRKKTIKAGSLRANAWGLYDMHGNMYEWVQDWYEKGFYSRSPVEDPVNDEKGSGRVLRGGSWIFRARDCRSAYRGRVGPGDRGSNVGFRVLRSVPF